MKKVSIDGSNLKSYCELDISGSKSESNRILILKSIFNNIKINNLSSSDDTSVLNHSLQNLNANIDVGHAGTSMRFLTAYLATLENKKFIISGSDRMHQRPIGLLVDALNSLGFKVKYLKKFFGRMVVDANVRNVFEIANFLHEKGYRNVNMVVGSDRIKEFDMLLNKYNGVKAKHGYYKFKNINIISAGERDPDADDVSGMSASKMREFAEKGDFEGFKDGVPSKGKNLAKKLYDDIRKGMGINEGNLPEYMIEDLITEGVYDPGIFKAVFLMGGPGSGKSTVVNKLGLKALGLKMVNTDQAFENGLKKAGLSLDLRGADFDKVDPIRARAKKITGKNMDNYIAGRLGMIFDTTAANKSKIINYKKLLDKLGYEYKMVFVMTSLENAQKRNDMRARKLPPEIVKSDWDKAMAAANEYKKLFGKDFYEIKNDDTVQALDKKAGALYSKLMTWTTSYPKNKLALKWKERMLARKKG